MSLLFICQDSLSLRKCWAEITVCLSVTELPDLGVQHAIAAWWASWTGIDIPNEYSSYITLNQDHSAVAMVVDFDAASRRRP